MYLNLSGHYLSYSHDFQLYSKKYMRIFAGKTRSSFKSCKRHQSTCEYVRPLRWHSHTTKMYVRVPSGGRGRSLKRPLSLVYGLRFPRRCSSLLRLLTLLSRMLKGSISSSVCIGLLQRHRFPRTQMFHHLWPRSTNQRRAWVYDWNSPFVPRTGAGKMRRPNRVY